MRTLIINNVKAGPQDGAIFDFMRFFATEDDEIVLRNINPHMTTAQLLEDAASFDLVIASGGDGTVASVAYELRNTGIPLMPFPAGTSNALAMNLESPEETAALAKLAREMRTLDFDMGEILIGGNSYGFQLVAGCGWDATIMGQAESTKRVMGPMAYFHAAVTNPLPQTAHFTLDIDGESIQQDGVGVLIANFSHLQFDVALVHENKPRDGKLDVIVLNTNNALELIPAYIATRLDKNGTQEIEGLKHYRGSRITVSANPALPVQYDGEPTIFTSPFEARILPKAVRYVVCENACETFRED